VRILKLFFLLIIISTFAFSGDDADKIISKLQNKYESIKDLTLTFTQNITFGISKMSQKIDGTIQTKKGNKYRIELEKQTVVTDGKTVWSYSHVNKQVIIDNFKDDPKSLSPDHILTNMPENYNGILIGNESVLNKQTSIIKLTPKDDKSLIKSMKVWVDLKDYIIRKVQIVDVSDNVTVYLVKSIVVNAGIKDEVFKFSIPNDAEKVDIR
jgi:chaperone LolA